MVNVHIDRPDADVPHMSALTVDPLLDRDAPEIGPAPVPCAARPSTGFVHRDGACRCFTGGPAPELAPSARPEARRTHLTLAR